MAETRLHLVIDVPIPGILRLVLSDAGGHVLGTSDQPLQGYVDNILLTAVDNLLKRSSIDRSAPIDAVAGPGIDKTSSLFRIVTSFASALAVSSATRPGA
jgi:hypothetical protein